MLLTVSTTHRPATDLGHLLHKHPQRVQAFPQPTGVAHVFYPEASDDRCTAALLLEVDPVGLVRGRHGEGFALGQYVNDRPYAASSLLGVAIKNVFSTAMAGQCRSHPELAVTPLPLELRLAALPCRGGLELLRRLVEPLGWQLDAVETPLDPTMPEWGASRYFDVRLTGVARLSDALRQLYVLLPVLDDSKHYWVGSDEIDKLVRAGQGWLAAHPERELIARRYLAHRGELTRAALARLAEIDDADPERFDDAVEPAVPDGDRTVSLAEHRRGAIVAVLRASGGRSVADLGCGEGRLVRLLLDDPAFSRVVGVDVSIRALQIASKRLRLNRMPDAVRDRVELFQSSLTYRDERLRGLDAVVLSEVIEHVDPPRLDALARTVFGYIAPGTVVMTTPNVEYNVRYEGLAPGARRHPDHRFEWTRAEFSAWCLEVATHHGYTVRLLPVGDEDPELGAPTQLAVFTRRNGAGG